MDSGQIAKAASIIESDNPRRAVKLYLEARRPGRAARVVLGQNELVVDEKLVADVLRALRQTNLMELAGEIHERTGDYLAAIEAYGKAGIFARALDLGESLYFYFLFEKDFHSVKVS